MELQDLMALLPTCPLKLIRWQAISTLLGIHGVWLLSNAKFRSANS